MLDDKSLLATAANIATVVSALISVRNFLSPEDNSEVLTKLNAIAGTLQGIMNEVAEIREDFADILEDHALKETIRTIGAEVRFFRHIQSANPNFEDASQKQKDDLASTLTNLNKVTFRLLTYKMKAIPALSSTVCSVDTLMKYIGIPVEERHTFFAELEKNWKKEIYPEHEQYSRRIYDARRLYAQWGHHLERELRAWCENNYYYVSGGRLPIELVGSISQGYRIQVVGYSKSISHEKLPKLNEYARYWTEADTRIRKYEPLSSHRDGYVTLINGLEKLYSTN